MHSDIAGFNVAESVWQWPTEDAQPDMFLRMQAKLLIWKQISVIMSPRFHVWTFTVQLKWNWHAEWLRFFLDVNPLGTNRVLFIKYLTFWQLPYRPLIFLVRAKRADGFDFFLTKFMLILQYFHLYGELKPLVMSLRFLDDAADIDEVSQPINWKEYNCCDL